MTSLMAVATFNCLNVLTAEGHDAERVVAVLYAGKEDLLDEEG